MRVITGTARGVKLATPANEEITTRPTPERVKEAIFSMIHFDIEGRTVLDLFAGTGQLGIEALSRGAESCDFLDLAPNAINLIKSNLEKTKLSEKAKVWTGDYKVFIKSLSKKVDNKKSYSLVFLDPPFVMNAIHEALALLDHSNLIANSALIVCETGDEMPIQREGFDTIRHTKYGNVYITLLRKGADL